MIMKFFVEHSREIKTLSAGMFFIELILIFFWLRAFKNEKKRDFYFLVIFLIMIINISLISAHFYFFEKFVREKTERLLKI